MVIGYPVGSHSPELSSLSRMPLANASRDFEDLASDGSQWPVLAQLIKSGQVPADRMAEIAKDYPEFWSTHIDGTDQKQSWPDQDVNGSRSDNACS